MSSDEPTPEDLVRTSTEAIITLAKEIDRLRTEVKRLRIENEFLEVNLKNTSESFSEAVKDVERWKNSRQIYINAIKKHRQMTKLDLIDDTHPDRELWGMLPMERKS
jgi:regulator of replication initiation timing